MPAVAFRIRAWLAALVLFALAGGACAPYRAPSAIDPVSVRVSRGGEAELLESALALVPSEDAERSWRLLELFQAAGCSIDRNFVSSVNRDRRRNLYCRLPGSDPETIVVSARVDPERASSEDAATADWPDLVMLPLLYHALASEPHRHSYVFAALGAAASSEIRPGIELERLPRFGRNQVVARVGLVGLGLGTTAVWSSKADPDLRLDLASVSKSIALPLRYVDLERRGVASGAPSSSVVPVFINPDPTRDSNAQSPMIVIHSYSAQTAPAGRSRGDTSVADHFDSDAYAQNLRMISIYLAYLDRSLGIRRDRGDLR
jgi:hypothetical protein